MRVTTTRTNPHPFSGRKTVFADIQNLRAERVGQAGRMDTAGGDPDEMRDSGGYDKGRMPDEKTRSLGLEILGRRRTRSCHRAARRATRLSAIRRTLIDCTSSKSYRM